MKKSTTSKYPGRSDRLISMALGRSTVDTVPFASNDPNHRQTRQRTQNQRAQTLKTQTQRTQTHRPLAAPKFTLKRKDVPAVPCQSTTAAAAQSKVPLIEVNTNSKVSSWLESNNIENDNISVVSSEAPSSTSPPHWFSNLCDKGHAQVDENESNFNSYGALSENIDPNIQQSQLKSVPADGQDHEISSQITQNKSVVLERSASKEKDGLDQVDENESNSNSENIDPNIQLSQLRSVPADGQDHEISSQITQNKSVVLERNASKEKDGVRTPSNVRDIAKRKLFFESNSSTTGNLKSFSCNSGSTDQTPPIIITETGNISHGNVNSLDILGDDSLDALFNTPNLDSPILNNPILNSPISIDSDMAFDFSPSPTPLNQSNRPVTRVVMVSKGDDDMLPAFFEEENSVELDTPNNVSQDRNETISSPDLSASTDPSSTSTPAGTRTSVTSSNSSNSRKRQVVPPRENTRKRSRNPAKWKKNLAKAGFNSGIEHETSRGKKKAARKLGPGCRPNCRKCDKKRRMTEKEREVIFHHFWNKLTNLTMKRSYISSRIVLRPPATCSTLPERAKKNVRTYYLSVGKERVKVCKKMFLDTFGVADCWIETALKKTKNNTDVASPEKRGDHKNRPHRSSARTIASVIKHVSLYPTMPSHYTRERSKRNYLDPGLRSVERMYRMYCTWADQNQVPKKASIGLYRKIFNSHFNLGFFMPRKDQCELCNRWKTAKNQEERRGMVGEWARHLETRKLVKKLKRADKASASETKCIACFDLQKVLNCPHSQTSLSFYKNKLSLYNLTIFDLRIKEGHCYLWTEVDAHKGSNEIGTNVLRFIEVKVAEGCNEFVLWSDSPTGQNRNRMVFSSFMQAAARLKIKITHRFFESGHSYSEADSMHALIEREAHMKEIYTPDEWISLISTAKQDGNSYIVNKLNNQEVLDLHSLVDQQIWDRDSRGRQVYWSEVREVVAGVDHNKPNDLYYRYNFSEQLKRVTITMKKDLDEVDLATYHPPQAYHGRFPLGALKLKHLKYLLDKKVVPTKHHPTFQEYMSVGN